MDFIYLCFNYKNKKCKILYRNAIMVVFFIKFFLNKQNTALQIN